MSAELWVAEGSDAGGNPFRVVARYPGPGLKAAVEDAADYEFRTLQAVQAAGIPAPRPLGIGESPDGSFLLLEFLDGRATAHAENPEAYVAEFASALASVHRVDLSFGGLSFLLATRRQFVPGRTILNEELGEREITDLLVGAGPQMVGEDGLRHGDFWPGNILWQGGKITGIIDWENALLGPAIADLAISRLDVFWILGRAAMEEFTARYLACRPMDVAALPYWDLRAALRPMENLPEWAGPYSALDRPDITPEHLRAVLLEFVDQALTRMASS
jgi:aminoglycoside phosphotransferase (APT) family kinase protein